MSTFLKPILLGLGLVAGIALAAPAQTVSGGVTPGPSIANLPPAGPRTNSYNVIPSPAPQGVAQSGAYPGPGPGEWTIKDPPHFQKPAGYDANVMMHPYDSDVSEKPN